LIFSGDFTSDQKPEKTFREGLFTTRGLGKELLAFRDGISAEANTLIGIKQRGFTNKTLNVSHSSVGHVNGDLSKNKVLVFSLEFLDLLLLDGDDLSKALFKIGSSVLRGFVLMVMSMVCVLMSMILMLRVVGN